ncbi:MAG: hypothetical protein FJW86_06010 [Actinobacteria bacterium]|nr:hypothetical protein [Actinomycetota bacterium]
MRRTLPLVLTIIAEVGAVIVLYRFVREPEFAVAIAFGFATWLLVSTVLYLAARLARIPTAVAAAGRLTLPVLRRRVDRALAASIMSGALVMSGAPAMAGTAPPSDQVVDATVVVEEPAPLPDPLPDPDPNVDIAPPIDVRTGRAGDPAAQTEASTVPVEDSDDTKTQVPAPEKTAPKPSTPLPTVKATDPEPTAPGAPSPPSPAPTTAAAPSRGQTHAVVSGDNLWEIAAQHLASTQGRERASLSPADIHPYWVRVCDANRSKIRSGDVNLIEPGEQIDLPPL